VRYGQRSLRLGDLKLANSGGQLPAGGHQTHGFIPRTMLCNIRGLHRTRLSREVAVDSVLCCEHHFVEHRHRVRYGAQGRQRSKSNWIW